MIRSSGPLDPRAVLGAVKARPWQAQQPSADHFFLMDQDRSRTVPISRTTNRWNRGSGGGKNWFMASGLSLAAGLQVLILCEQAGRSVNFGRAKASKIAYHRIRSR